MRYLGIDYGTKRVGLALSDASGRFAAPHSVVPTNLAYKKITELCQAEAVAKIVLGSSLNYQGQANPVQSAILDFKKQLETSLNLPVILVPEYLTSQEADRLIGSDAETDARAAALILKHHLDSSYNQ